jgi:hypothetical protein
MSRELIDPLVARLRHEEAVALEQRAAKEAAEVMAIERQTGIKDLCRDRARKVGKALIDMHEEYRTAGFFKRLFLDRRPRTALYYQESVTEFDGYMLHVPTNFSAWNSSFETGVRTVPFGIEVVDHEELTFDVGWEVGVQQSVIHTQGGKETSRKISKFAPVWVWQVATERTTGETERKTQFEINASNGTVYSYEEDKRDDPLVTLGKEAGAQAFKLMGEALELLER